MKVVRLRVFDIDSERNLIHVKNSKGRKGRYTILSDAAKFALREFWNEYHPDFWLFPGKVNESSEIRDAHLTVRSVENIFTQACKRAKITKK